MRYVQLRAFHYVCLHGGFSKAANALYLTQPAVSDQVRKLEEEYDLLLFSRRGKQVTPTRDGQALLEITRRFFDAESQAVDFLQDKRTIATGQLRIIADSAMHLIDILGAFRAKHPDVIVTVQTGNSESVANSLRTHDADIGVSGMDLNNDAYNSISLNASPLIAFVGADHSFATKRSVTLKNLLSQPLILREQGSRTRSLVETHAREKGLKVIAAIEAQGREAVQELVAIGAGVGIVSAAELTKDPRLVPLTLSDCDIQMRETLICLPERRHSKVIDAFFNTATECLSS